MIDVPMVKRAIDISNGKFFRVIFKKRTNGTLRVMDCRTGVKKGVKGVGHKFNPTVKGLVSVWDIHKEDYRFVNIEDVVYIKSRGVTVIDHERVTAELLEKAAKAIYDTGEIT